VCTNFLILFIGKVFKHICMHIKLKKNLKLTNARKYKAIKFKLRCDYTVNMN